MAEFLAGAQVSAGVMRAQALVADSGAGESAKLVDLGQALVKLLATVGTLVAEWSWTELIVRAGWLPHASIPLELVFEAQDIADTDQRLTGHFRSDWAAISESLRASVAAAVADSNACDAFVQSLRAHDLGMYRVAPVLLFPHVERLARAKLLPGAQGASPAVPLQMAVGELGPSQFTMAGVSGLRLYQKLAEHLYKQVRTADEIAAAQADPVPNRNAALHGRVDYASEKSSLNMMIMADFIFDALSKVPPAPR
ncbi:MAG: hypothetical protein KF730_17245 [Sphingomonas sp.]|uniref:hypothetical protein n=1 Tax=Sphingomonas sp. TaxID=28214 RepID=UPI0025DA27B0|nr:hypothetical protein [Sphingomonas sp.]MBX3566308.1 hypothetical protein [Sphingomonas sp.]